MNNTTRPSGIALATVLVAALALRVWGLGFGLPFANARPDETAVAGPAVAMLAGDLRPPSFNKPTLFVYVVSAAYAAYYAVTAPFSDYRSIQDFAESRRHNIAPFLYISRALSAVMGVCCVWWLYGLAVRLTGDESVALLAAAFQAVAFLPARESHFGVTDMPMTALVVLAIGQIVAWRQTGGWRRAALAGLIGGLAMSVKYNGLGLAVPFAIAAALRAYEAGSAAARRRVALEAPLFAGVMAVAFVAGSPFVVIDASRFLRDVTAQEAVLDAGHGLALARGWWQHLWVTLPAAVGWPMYLAGLAGAAALLVRDAKKSVVVLAFPLAYYVAAGYGHTVFARYMLPVVPFICLTAAWAVIAGARALRAERVVPVALSAGLCIAAPSAVRIVQTDYLLDQTDNRVVVANALRTLVRRHESICQTGASYGQVQFPPNVEHEVAESDLPADFTGPGMPDWILVQHSPLLLYSSLGEGLRGALRAEYVLVRSFPVSDERPRLYDQQDAFYLPLTDLSGVIRPGPSFELYRRR